MSAESPQFCQFFTQQEAIVTQQFYLFFYQMLNCEELRVREFQCFSLQS